MISNSEEARKYWNSEKIVREFSEAKVPQYWVSFFSSFHHPENYMVLDLGCGGGRNTCMITSLGFNVVACDLHDNMVTATLEALKSSVKSFADNVKVMKANMLELPYCDGTYDIVLANGIYHNTSSYEEFSQAIRESARVLKEGGYLCMNVFTDETLDSTLIKQKRPYLYVTPDNLDVLLLPIDTIVLLLKQNSLFPDGKLMTYQSEINVGTRSVLRGVLKKNTNNAV